jgi:SAM-dependent methyltransferase
VKPWWEQPRETLHHFDEPALPLQPYGLAVPSYALRMSAGTGDLAMFLGIGEAWAQIVSRFLPDDPVLLDLGCGCGKLARFLHLNPRLRYVGVDIFLPSILWCRRAFERSSDRFRFEHFDGRSATYNPEGSISTTEIILPADGGSVDAVVCGSLFTHLLEPDARHYLREIARVLRNGGCAFISLHTEPAAGEKFSGNEDRMEVDEDHFLAVGEMEGLLHDQLIGTVYGQTVHLFRRAL